MGGMADPARGRGGLAGRRKTGARRVVGGADCAAEGDRRLDRGQAEFEYLYDKPYPDNSRIRVAGRSRSRACRRIVSFPATDDTLIDELADPAAAGTISRRWCSKV